jgi:hypothetical protein
VRSGPVMPFRVFGRVARREALPPRRRPLGIGYSFRVPGPSKYREYWFRDPALPLAISSAVRSSFAGLHQAQLSVRCPLSSSFAFLQSLAQHVLVRRPRPANTSHGLSLPSALAGSEVHGSRALPARCVPPAGFGYPLGGLLPPSPCRLFFTPAALLGFALRSFLLAEGIRRVSAGMNPPAVSPVGYPGRQGDWAGPTGRGFWAFTLPRVPGNPRRISTWIAGCSLGLFPLRACQQKPRPGFRPGSSHTLRSRPSHDRRPPAPRSLARPSLGLVPVAQQTERLGRGNPCRVFAPVRARTFELRQRPSYFVRCVPRRTSLPTGR